MSLGVCQLGLVIECWVLGVGELILPGLAAITLAVVGYVSFERYRYKKQFRARKEAAEAGMSQAAWVR